MLFKLLSLLGAGKGGVVAAAAIVAGVSTVNVATMPEFQEGLREVVAAVSTVMSPGMSQLKNGRGCGQPVVVAQRNAADKLLRDAYQSSHRELTDLRGGKDVDHQKASEIVKDAQEELREVLRTSLNEVAALTLGREGQLKDKSGDDDETASPSPTPTGSPITTFEPSPSPSSSPTASPSASPSPEQSCPPEASETPEPSPSPDASPDTSPRGRAAVAARVTLDPALAAIVEEAKTDMKAIVDKAKDDVSKLDPVERGKPEDKGKPESDEGTSDQRGKPSDKPGGRPSPRPGRP
jgi:hypothetical protein